MREDYARSNDRITCGCARCLTETRLLLARSLATWHTAQPNTSQLDRENTIQGYCSASIVPSVIEGRRRGTQTGGMMGPEMLAALEAAGRLTESQRAVLGLGQAA